MLASPPPEQIQASMSTVLEIFKKWAVVFSNKYKKENVSKETLEIWAIALIDLNVTDLEVALALRLSLTQKWPPSSPADFIELARQHDEYPDAHTAFKVACNNSGAIGDHVDWLHSVVRETAGRLGRYNLARATDSEFKRFKEVYERVKTEHRQGADFKIPESNRLTHEDEPPASIDTVDNYMTQIKQQLAKARLKNGQ